MYCNQCGQKLENGTRFCGECGTKINLAYYADIEEGVDTKTEICTEEPATTPTLAPKKFVISRQLLVTCIVIIGVVGGIFLFGGIGDDTNKVEKTIEKFIQSVYNQDFETFINLLTIEEYEDYQSRQDYDQQMHKGLFNLVSNNLNYSYGSNWIDDISIKNIETFEEREYEGAIADIYLGNTLLRRLELVKQNGKYCIYDGFYQLEYLY